MKIIISPAKSFKDVEGIGTTNLIFEEKTKILVNKLKKYTLNEMGNLNRTNDKLTEKAYFDYQDFDFDNLSNPAIFSYDGLVFKQFDRDDFEDLKYLDEHVYILSALYGALTPLTGISDYRLYFENSDIDLYDFWNKDIYKEIYKDNDLIINLASKEYTKTIRPYIKSDQKFITLDFKEDRDGKIKSVVAWTKQMRGKMLKYLIQNKIEDIDQIKQIEIDDYLYDPYNSTSDNILFIRRHS